jgi:hypothetical protein
MPEQNPNTTPATETASNGDPSLGPLDVRLKIQLSLLGQREILVQDDVSSKLSNALNPAARGLVVASIETSVQLLLQKAVTQYNELVLQRTPNAEPENQIAGYGPAAGPNKTTVPHVKAAPDFPERLPPPPKV